MAECRAEYERKGGRQPGDRIIRCGLDAGHYPHTCHEEADTGVRWWDIPPSLQLRRPPSLPSDDEMADVRAWNALTARAERAEAAIKAVRRLALGWQEPVLSFVSVYHPDAATAILAALDSTDPVEDAPDGGHVWGSDASWCRRCGMVRGSVGDVSKWPCTGKLGVFRNGPPDAQRPEERSDEGPKKLMRSRFPKPVGRDTVALDAESDSGLPVDGEERK